MKFNIRKISAVGASVLMAGLTMGTAVAANYPAPFVTGGSANTAVVYGQNAHVLDSTEAGSIQSDLAGYVTGTSGSGSSTVTGDSVQLSKSTDKFNLGDGMGEFYNTIDDNELSNLLAEGIYKNDGNDEFDYEQEVTLANNTLTHFQSNDFNNDEPALGFELSGGTSILNYTLDFTPDNAESDEADWNEFEGTTIDVLGKEYYILSASNTTGSETLELLDSAADGTVSTGETVTVESGGNTYDVQINVIEDGDTASLIINGETTNSLDEDDTYKLNSGEYVGIKNVVDASFQGDTDLVEFSIGTGKIKLVDGDEIELNGEDVSDLDEYDGHELHSYVVPSGTNNGSIDSFTIEWKLASGNTGDTWLAYGTDSTELLLPVFNNLKLSLGNFVKDASEVSSIDPDGSDSFTLNTDVEDGSATLNLLYQDASGVESFAGIGASATEELVTNSSSNPIISWDENSSYFVATWINGDDFESYVLEVSDIDDSTTSDNVTISSLASNTAVTVTADGTDSDDIGEISFTVGAASEASTTATITLSSSSGSGTVTADKIVTAEGLKIQLPVSETNATGSGIIGGINLSASETSWVMNFSEEDDDGNVEGGSDFNATLGFNSNETSVTATSVTDYETTDGSDDYVGYVSSALATMTMFATGGDQDSIDITYHGSEAYGEVFLSEASSVVSGGDSVSQNGVMLVTDSEVSSVSSKNLVVVGGSCINSAAATLVGGNYCESDWTDATGVGSGQFLIKGYSGSETNGLTSEMALLVAGYEREDTAKASTYLQTQTVDTSAGNVYSTASEEVITTA